METVGLWALTAILSLVAAAFIGMIVSFDVRGLIHSQHRDFSVPQEGSGKPLKTPGEQAKVHAFWHASLFLFYSILASGVLANFLTFGFKLVWNDLSKILEKIYGTAPCFDDVTASFLLFLNVAILFLVWLTYKDKLIEDHSKKLRPSQSRKASNPITDKTEANASNLRVVNPLSQTKRIDIKLIYEFLRRYRTAGRLVDHALALTVAVDMLAITAMLRVLFDGAPDTEFPDYHFNFVAYSGLPGGLMAIINYLIFSLVIAGVVYWYAKGAAENAMESRTRLEVDQLMGLRIAEPWLVFTMLFWTIPHQLFVTGIDWWDNVILRLAASFVLGAVLTGLLIALHGGFSKVRKCVAAGMNFTTELTKLDELKDEEREAHAKQLNGQVLLLSSVMLVVGFAFLGTLAHAYAVATPAENPRIVFFEHLALIVTIVTALLLFSPWTGVHEFNLDMQLKPPEEPGRYIWTLSREALCTLLAISLVVGFGQYLGGGWAIEGASSAIWLLVAYAATCFLLVIRRAHRQQSIYEKHGEDAPVSFHTVADILTAVGVASFVWIILLKLREADVLYALVLGGLAVFFSRVGTTWRAIVVYFILASIVAMGVDFGPDWNAPVRIFAMAVAIALSVRTIYRSKNPKH